MTFADLQSEIAELIWPDGVPENLAVPIRKMFVDALIDLQRCVPCLQAKNTSIYPQSATLYKCGLSIIQNVPRGVIRKIYTVRDEKWCDPVHYRQETYDYLKCWSRNLTSFVDEPANEGFPELPLGFKYPESSTDSQFGRALTGIWAIERGSLIIAPWLQSDEMVVVEWDGIQRKYADTDQVTFGGLDSDNGGDDLKRAIEAFVRTDFAKKFDQDFSAAQAYERDYQMIRADLIHECREETRLREANVCQNEKSELARNYVLETTDDEVSHEEEPPTIFAQIGDFGEAAGNVPADDVAELVNGWDPEFIVTSGDNDYVGDYDDSVGSRYDESIMVPCLGNHDLDLVADGVYGKPYLTYFTTPAGKRYYDYVKGRVHIFVLNSGYDTGGTLREAAGIHYGSIQSDWLLARIAQSTARWKIVVFHHPAFTSGDSHPAVETLRWPFATMGVDLVLNGHNHHYERLEKGGLTYIVNGAGGRTLNGFGDIDSASKFRYSSDYGALRLEAACATLKGEFYNRAGTLIDSFTLSK